MKHLFKGIFLFSFTVILFTVSARAQSPGNPAPLPNRTMLSLSGYQKQNSIELKGSLSASHSYNRLIIERGEVPGTFEQIGELSIAGTASSEFHFTYQDLNPGSGVNYYRIKLINSHTKVNEITNTLMIKMDNDTKDLEIINTVIQSANPVITIKSMEDEEAFIQAIDLNGCIVRTAKVNINNGINNISLPGFTGSKGFFVIVVKTKKKTKTQRMLLQ